MISSFTLCNSRTTSSKISCRIRSSDEFLVCKNQKSAKPIKQWMMPTCFILSNSVSDSLVLPMGLTLQQKEDVNWLHNLGVVHCSIINISFCYIFIVFGVQKIRFIVKYVLKSPLLLPVSHLFHIQVTLPSPPPPPLICRPGHQWGLLCRVGSLPWLLHSI